MQSRGGTLTPSPRGVTWELLVPEWPQLLRKGPCSRYFCAWSPDLRLLRAVRVVPCFLSTVTVHGTHVPCPGPGSAQQAFLPTLLPGVSFLLSSCIC